MVFSLLLGVPATPAVRCDLIYFNHEDRAILLEVKAREAKLSPVNRLMQFEIIDQVISEMKNILNLYLGDHLNHSMTGRELGQVYQALVKSAEESGIHISQEDLGMMGVYPKGLYEIATVGFRLPTKLEQPVGFAMRHELGHLFHVIAVRKILVAHLKLYPELSSVKVENFLNEFEGAANYRELEKIVTDLSGGLHPFLSEKAANGRYIAKISEMLTGIKVALLSNHLRFKNGWGVVEIYAKFLSKAPILLGTSLKDLSLRLSLFLFAENYFVNDSFRILVNHLIGIE